MLKDFAKNCDPDPYQGGSPDKAVYKPKDFTVSLLRESDIPAFLRLQQKAWNALPPDKKHHLKLRDEDDLKEHLANRMPLIGVKDPRGKLVAQCLLAYPLYEDAVKNLDGYPINGSASVTAIVQSLSADPDIRGMNLSQMVLDAAKDRAAMSGHLKLLAKVADDNEGSRKSFCRNAFTVAAHGQDLKQGYAVTYWQYLLRARCDAASTTVALDAKLS